MAVSLMTTQSPFYDFPLIKIAEVPVKPLPVICNRRVDVRGTGTRGDRHVTTENAQRLKIMRAAGRMTKENIRGRC